VVTPDVRATAAVPASVAAPLVARTPQAEVSASQATGEGIHLHFFKFFEKKKVTHDPNGIFAGILAHDETTSFQPTERTKTWSPSLNPGVTPAPNE
jgi:hypothetical protein